MEFSSLAFLFIFLPLFLALFLLSPRSVRNIFLLLASLAFYFWGEGSYLLLLLASIIINHFLGSLVTRYASPLPKKLVFIAALAFNIGLLVFFKYIPFIFKTVRIESGFSAGHLPLGISFFTFQAISYLVDIYRKTVPVDHNPLNFALYISFFPKLATGPITPYHDFSRQIQRPIASMEDVNEGVRRFITGLAKKVLIANVVGRTADQIFALSETHLISSIAWLGVIAYAVQIFFDFSGYSDMAIGLARICGYRLLENFNYPYAARSIKDFWARWHISLAKWLRDYLFLPIAYKTLRLIKKDRFLKLRAEDWAYCLGAFLTFSLCGLWHGSNWTFVIWGTFFGVMLIAEHLGLGKFLKRKPLPLRLLYTQFLVLLAWVFFRSPDLSHAFSYFRSLFDFGKQSTDLSYLGLYADRELLLTLAIGLILSFPVVPALARRYSLFCDSLREQGKSALSILLRGAAALLYNLGLLSLFLLSIIYIVAGSYNPFIYFRF